MEALLLSPYKLPLLRPKRLELTTPTFGSALNINSDKNGRDLAIRRHISATLYKPTSEISSTAVTSLENPFPVYTQTSPPPRMKVSPDSLQYPPGFLGAALPDRTSPNDADGENITDAMEYLTNILSSKVYDVAIESPLQHAAKLSERLGVTVWLKREDLQPVSFNFYNFFAIFAIALCVSFW